MYSKYTEEEVINMFSDVGCKLINKYESTSKPLVYECRCGNISTTQFHHFKNGNKTCPFCRKRKDIKDVIKIFKDKDCELLTSEYINSHTPLKYRCSCGNISRIALSNFQNGKRCMKCASVGRSGKNNGNYNFDLNKEERVQQRLYVEYYEWRKLIYERDSYTCQKCGDSKGSNLNAHHIKQYYKYIESRTSLDNGITLCINCHKEFHSQYGWKFYSEKDFEDFKENDNYIRFR